jgi:outer membrane protein OmpA-like peptidoglycan-associated protein
LYRIFKFQFVLRMTKTVKRTLLSLLALTSSMVALRPAFGQTDSSAIMPSNSISTGHSYIGIDLGITGSDYLGAHNFLWGIETSPNLQTYLPYTNLGTGIGFVGGIKAGFELSSWFDLEGKLRFLTNHTSKQESHPDIYLDPDFPSSTADAINNYSLTLSSIDLAVLGHIRLSDRFYGIAGFSASSLIGNTFSASQSVDSQGGYRHLNIHNLSDTSEQHTGPVTLDNWFNGLRADAQLGIGSVYRLGASNILLDVELLVSIPFTPWLTKVADSTLNATATKWLQPSITDPHLWYATLTFGLRLPFHDLPPPIPSDPSYSSELNHSQGMIVDSRIDTTSSGIMLTGHVIDASTGQPVSAEMTAVDLSNNQIISKTHTDSNGNYRVRVENPGKYSVTANANGYLFGTAYFEVDSEGRILKSNADIMLGGLTGGKTRLLIFFAFDQADLQPASAPELNRAVELMKAVPTMKVEIAGYSDSLGTVPHNMDLSLRRANAVRDFLTVQGISATRITAHGYGPTSPIATNTTDAGRAENRRVEFVVKER